VSAQASAGAQPPAHEIICLVPELCFMTGLTESMRTDANIKKELGVHTRLSPAQRFTQVQVLLDQIRGTPEAIRQINQWGLELEKNLNCMDGRVVPCEKIFFKRKEVETDAKADWTRACAMEEVISGVEINNWICIYPAAKESLVAKFAEVAMDAGKRIGVRIAMPQTIALRDDKPDSYYNEIKKHLNPQVS
jgi:aubergine-like protein